MKVQDKQKQKKRAENWTAEEKAHFVEVMKNKISAIENKCVGPGVDLSRKAAWNRVLMTHKLRFPHRTISQLRTQWKNRKFSARKLYNDIKKAAVQTGGGSPLREEDEADEDVDLQMINMLPNAEFEPILNPVGSDATIHVESIASTSNDGMFSSIIIYSINIYMYVNIGLYMYVLIVFY